MDDGRFDDVTRRLGRLTSPALPRRGLLRLAAALATSAAWPDPAGAAKDDRGTGKNNDKNKNENTRCKEDGKKCQKSKDCCDSKCTDGRCGSSAKCKTKVGSSPTRWGSNGTGNGQFRNPWGIATDPDGNVYVTDTGNSRIQVFTAGGSFIRKWGSRGNGTTQFQDPLGIGANQEGNKNNGKTRVYVADPSMSDTSRRLRRFNTSGDFQESLGRNGLSNPRGVAIDGSNNIWVVNAASSGAVFLFDKNGNFRTSWTPSGDGELTSPEGIAVFEDKDDKVYVYVTNTGKSRIVRYQFTGTASNGLKFIKSAGSPGSGSSSFSTPIGVAADGCGNLWVADRGNDRIQQLDKSLNFQSRFTAGFDRPTGVALSPNGKSLYVVDSNNDRIQRFSLG